MNMEGSHLTPEPAPEPPQENKIWSRIKSVLLFLVLIGIVIASFRVSFYLGKKILFPARKPAERIEAVIPEPPPSIKALQKLQAAMSAEARKKELKAAEAPLKKKVYRPVQSRVYGRKHYYKVQAGVFEDEAAAEELGEKISEAGFDVYIKRIDPKWRVQVGAFRARSAAEAVQSELNGKGFKSEVIYE